MCWALNLLLDGRSHLRQGVLDVPGHICWKDRARIHGFRHWLLPRLQQAFHSFSGVLIHDEIGAHEGLVHVAAEVDGVWGANVLDD